MKGERKRALGIRTEGSEFADDGQVLAKLKKKVERSEKMAKKSWTNPTDFLKRRHSD